MTVASEAAIAPDGREIDDAGPAAEFGSADDVKSILNNIALLIADADRRHGEALSDMRARLASLGQEAHSVRERVPEQYRTAFERIEDGLAHLADRIAETEAERQQSRAAAPAVAPAEASIATPPAPVDSSRVEAAGSGLVALQPGAAVVAEPELPSPVALVSALQTGEPKAEPDVIAHHDSAGHRSDAPAIDPFEVTDATAAQDDSPWDREQAEALTRLYETGEAGLAPLSLKVSPGPAAAPPPMSPAAAAPAGCTPLAETPAGAGIAAATDHQPQPIALASAQVPAPIAPPLAVEPACDVHREWLETKFAEIAERVELSLAEMRPEGAFANLEARFEQMETRFTAALEDVANRNDPEGLRQVEAQIHELAQHVEVAQHQLQRLGSIEAQLTAVVDQLSDQRLAELLDQSSHLQQPDLQSLAMAAAEEVAARMAAVQPATGAVANADAAVSAEEAQRLNELRDMLHSFMLERRQGEENTASMLDTMQHAMIRLLDRVEAIEMNQGAAAQPAVPIMGTLEAPAVPAPVEVKSPLQGAPAPVLPPVAQPAEPVEDAPVASRVAHETQPAREPVDASPAADAANGPMSLEQLRAAARRAQAAAAAAAEADGGKQPSAKGPGKAAGKPAKAGKAEGGSNTKRSLLVGALALLVLVPAALMLLPKPKTATPAKSAAPAIERPTDGNLSTPQSSGKGAALDFSPGLSESDTASADRTSHAAESEQTDASELAEAAAAAEAPAAPPAQIETAGVNPPPAALQGVTVQVPNRAPTPEDIARLRNQQHMAQLSGQLGIAQARMQSEQAAQSAAVPAATPFQIPPGAKVVQVAHAISAPATEPAQPQSAQDIGARASGLDLPPAMVGPLSMRIAAAKGDPSAEFEVAARYAEGKGVPQDFKQAHAWYQRAASQGLAQAQYRLGTLFERGLGTTVDLAHARIWYQRAAEQGSVKAMHNLAVLSAGRDAGTPDYTAAAQWFVQAAERGLADSQFNLAVLNENGLGVAKDLPQAYKWYALAASSGDKESARRRDLLKAKLAPDELVQAEAMVRGFSAKPADRMANDARMAGEAWKSRQGAATN